MILRGDDTAEKQSEYDRETIFHFRYLQRIDLNYFMHCDDGPCLPVRLAPHHAAANSSLRGCVRDHNPSGFSAELSRRSFIS